MAAQFICATSSWNELQTIELRMHQRTANALVHTLSCLQLNPIFGTQIQPPTSSTAGAPLLAPKSRIAASSTSE